MFDLLLFPLFPDVGLYSQNILPSIHPILPDDKIPQFVFHLFGFFQRGKCFQCFFLDRPKPPGFSFAVAVLDALDGIHKLPKIRRHLVRLFTRSDALFK